MHIKFLQWLPVNIIAQRNSTLFDHWSPVIILIRLSSGLTNYLSVPVSANSSVTTLSLMNYLSMTICKHPPNPSSRQTDYRSVPIRKQPDETKFSITYSSVILSHRKCTRLPSTCTPTWSRESGRDFQMLMLDISLNMSRWPDTTKRNGWYPGWHLQAPPKPTKLSPLLPCQVASRACPQALDKVMFGISRPSPAS